MIIYSLLLKADFWRENIRNTWELIREAWSSNLFQQARQHISLLSPIQQLSLALIFLGFRWCYLATSFSSPKKKNIKHKSWVASHFEDLLANTMLKTCINCDMRCHYNLWQVDILDHALIERLESIFIRFNMVSWVHMTRMKPHEEMQMVNLTTPLITGCLGKYKCTYSAVRVGRCNNADITYPFHVCFLKSRSSERFIPTHLFLRELW